MTRNITLKIQLNFCGTSGSQALMHLYITCCTCAMTTLQTTLDYGIDLINKSAIIIQLVYNENITGEV